MLISILPEWACFVLTMVFVLISHEVGFKFGMHRRNRPASNPETAAGALSGATLGADLGQAIERTSALRSSHWAVGSIGSAIVV
jgi:hypothetical protein